MQHDFDEVADAIPVDQLVEEILKRRKESKPHLYNQITVDVVNEMMSDASDDVRKKVVSDLGIVLWARFAEEVRADSGARTGSNSSGNAKLIGRIGKRRYAGKDAAAGAEVEDRREVI